MKMSTWKQDEILGFSVIGVNSIVEYPSPGLEDPDVIALFVIQKKSGPHSANFFPSSSLK